MDRHVASGGRWDVTPANTATLIEQLPSGQWSPSIAPSNYRNHLVTLKFHRCEYPGYQTLQIYMHAYKGYAKISEENLSKLCHMNNWSVYSNTPSHYSS